MLPLGKYLLVAAIAFDDTHAVVEALLHDFSLRVVAGKAQIERGM